MRTVRFPIAGLMVAVLIVALGLAALRNSSATWAGMTFLLTCGVLCLAIVGIVCDVSARRAWWLVFALFGWGYLLLAFWSSVELPTMAVLDAVGERLGLSVHFSGGMGGGMRSAGLWGTALFGGFGGFGGRGNQPIIQISHCLLALLAALIGGVTASLLFGGRKESANAVDTRARLRLQHDAEGGYGRKSIQAATRGPDGKSLPIYVDPIGLQEAEKSMTSVVLIDLEGVPLKTSLRLCLQQLGLVYSIRDGLLLITSEESATPVYEDPILMVGHGLLALFAAGIGSFVAPLVAGMRRERVA